MARFYGEVGYGDSQEKPEGSGVWKDVITEISYQGDVVRTSSSRGTTGDVNEDIVLGNSISIVADQYAVEHFSDIKYVKWDGVLWTVTNVVVQRPRLILQLGRVYNGPTASTS